MSSRPRRHLPVAVTALVAGAAAVLALTGCTSAVGEQGAPDKGFVAGDGSIARVAVPERGAPVSFRGTTLQGKRFDVADHRGEVVVVNVWGSWCGPCVKEAPDLQRVWAQVGGTLSESGRVQFIGINTRDTTVNALAHERRFHVTYPSISDDEGRVLLALRGTLPPKAVPSTLVLDRRGRVAARALVALNTSTLRGLVEDTLAEPSTQARR